jgi:hypothetical protein
LSFASPKNSFIPMSQIGMLGSIRGEDHETTRHRLLAKPGLGDDATEDRAEFVELVTKLAGTRERNLPAPAEVVPKVGK